MKNASQLNILSLWKWTQELKQIVNVIFKNPYVSGDTVAFVSRQLEKPSILITSKIIK